MYAAAPHTIAHTVAQPTDPHLVWGRKQERRDKRFQARAALVDELISCWTEPHWTAVDISGGAGRWLSTLAPRFRRFSHLDLSPEALRIAQSDHPEFPHVDYCLVDLLKPRARSADCLAQTWDVVFCLDTLLYRGAFVETVLSNLGSFMSPRGIAIIDVPTQFRASISQCLKGRRYGGPERKLWPKAARTLVTEAGYECLATAYHYAELGAPAHRVLAARGLTGWLPWPSTWMYLVIRPRRRF
jgi:SAM-dependent methyltransferase